jgi:hypothetical protein
VINQFLADFNEGKLAALIVAGLTLIVVTKILTSFFIKLVHGHPPTPPPSKPECNHDENMTGECLRHGGCKTVDQCNATVEGWHQPIQQE